LPLGKIIAEVDRLILAVDIGGTKVAAGLVDDAGKFLRTHRVPMHARGTAAEAMECVHQAIAPLLSEPEGITAIGISSPGPLDPEGGMVLDAPNLPCWKNFPLLAEVRKRYHLPSKLDNDANAAGLAEALWGAAKGFRYVLYITIGTGIGTAIVLDRNIYYGRTGAAAEGGHMTIDYRGEIACGCGKPGCIESLAAGPALARAAQKLVADDPKAGASLLKLADGKVTSVTGETVIRAAQAGDPLAVGLLGETVTYLGVWIGNMIDLMEPDVIVMGGGMGAALKPWLGDIQTASSRWTINRRASEIPLVAAHYGADAGLAGSAALWLQAGATRSATK
jgi:glucokinase